MTDLIAVGSVYKLVSPSGLVYIGSTKKTLATRLCGHKTDYKRFLKGNRGFVSSFVLFEESNNIKIELVEEIKDCLKSELYLLERKYIETNECVNKYVPIYSAEERKAKHNEEAKAYYVLHKDDIKEYKAEYLKLNHETLLKKYKEHYAKNRDSILASKKEYLIMNREMINSKKRAHYEKNKIALGEKAKQKIFCEACKCDTTKGHKTKHEKTQKHINNAKILNQTNNATTINVTNNYYTTSE